MEAGTQYTFQIQSRDFYSNNKKMTLADAIESDYQIAYTNEDGQTKVLATLADDSSGQGAFLATYTLIKTGNYTL